MKLTRVLQSLLACLFVLAVAFVAVSLFDILLAVLYLRFYTTAAFIVIFGVGGIFAGVLAYSAGIFFIKENTPSTRWLVGGFILLAGLIFVLLLARLEGGEYEAAFRSFGITSGIAAFVMARMNIT